MFSKRLKVFLESPRVDSNSSHLNEDSKEATLVDYSTDEEGAEEENDLLDIEDVGLGLKKNVSTDKTPKKMVTPKLRASLEKQRYKIVGSHSGVKVRKAGWLEYLYCRFVDGLKACFVEEVVVINIPFMELKAIVALRPLQV
jgi:hypothetical protein